MKYALALLIFCTSQLLYAQTARQNYQGCANEECYSQAENLGAVAGILLATFVPLSFLPDSSRGFLTRQKSEFILGGFIQGTSLAAMRFDLSEIPNTDFGLKFSTTMASLKDNFPTNLRYEITPDYALFKNSDQRLALGLGLAVEKMMESHEYFIGSPVEITWHRYFSDAWKFKFNAGAYFLKKPVYRGSLQFFFTSGKNSSQQVITFGYQAEDSQIQNTVSHYLYLGMLF